MSEESARDREFTLTIEVENVMGAELPQEEREIWQEKTLRIKIFDREKVGTILNRLEIDHGLPAESGRLLKGDKVLDLGRSLRKQGIENKDVLRLQDKTKVEILSVRNELFLLTWKELSGFRLIDPSLGPEGEVLKPLLNHLKEVFVEVINDSEAKLDATAVRKEVLWLQALPLITQCPDPFAWYLLSPESTATFVEYDDITTKGTDFISWNGFCSFWKSQYYQFLDKEAASYQRSSSPSSVDEEIKQEARSERESSEEALIPEAPKQVEVVARRVKDLPVHPRQAVPQRVQQEAERLILYYEALRAKGKIDKWGLATLGIAHHCVGNAKEALSRLEEVSGTDVFAGNGEEAGLLCWRLGILYEEALNFDAASLWLEKAMATAVKDPLVLMDMAAVSWRRSRGWTAVWYWHKALWEHVAMEEEALAMLAAALLVMSNKELGNEKQKDNPPTSPLSSFLSEDLLTSPLSPSTPLRSFLPEPTDKPFALNAEATKHLGLHLLRHCIARQSGSETVQQSLQRWGVSQARGNGSLAANPWILLPGILRSLIHDDSGK